MKYSYYSAVLHMLSEGYRSVQFCMLVSSVSVVSVNGNYGTTGYKAAYELA